MHTSFLQLLLITIRKNVEEGERRRKRQVLLLQYRVMRKAYIEALWSTDWDHLLALKSMLAEILALMRLSGG